MNLRINNALRTSCRSYEISHEFQVVEIREISPIVEMTTLNQKDNYIIDKASK
jgi:hypothetical protein